MGLSGASIHLCGGWGNYGVNNLCIVLLNSTAILLKSTAIQVIIWQNLTQNASC